MTRPTYAEILLENVRHNYKIIKEYSSGYILAVVKADAYGHGLKKVATSLAHEVDGFAVANIEEALELRYSRISCPILLLEGFFDISDLKIITQNDLMVVLHHSWQVEAVLATRLEKPISVWLKLDTGMHRIGVEPEFYRKNWMRLKSSAKVKNLVKMTHLANADKPKSGLMRNQMRCFNTTTSQLLGATSISNSAAVLGLNIQDSWKRIGLLLYGVAPFLTHKHPILERLRPALNMRSQIISTRYIRPGEVVGYGGNFKSKQKMRIGVVAVGYADGYPYQAVSGTPILVDGARARLIGAVSMDMLQVDLSAIPTAQVGSEVLLWGQDLAVNEVARHAKTIPYQILSNIKRVKRCFCS